jgi:hypothetical protein
MSDIFDMFRLRYVQSGRDARGLYRGQRVRPGTVESKGLLLRFTDRSHLRTLVACCH